MESGSISKLEEKAWNLFAQDVSLYEPLEIVSYKTEKTSSNSKKYVPDAYLTLSWKGKKFKFTVEVTGNLYLEAKLARIKERISDLTEFLIVVPYITKGISELVKRAGICCLDLSGNYYIQREDLLAIRLDQPDQFKPFSRIKKFYSGNSSLVGRLLLAGGKKYPPGLLGLQRELTSRGGEIAQSTISKVLKEMEKDQVILREEDGLKLLQPEKLLERLTEQYRKPDVTRTIKINCPNDPIEWLNENYPKMWVRTGVSSAERYSVSVVDRIPYVYVYEKPAGLDLESVRPNLSKVQDDRYYKLVVNFTSDSWIYFDCQDEGPDRWSSQIQSYLELAQMDKREKEIAETIKETILSSHE